MIKIRQITEEDFSIVTKVLKELPFRIPKHAVSTLGIFNPQQFLVAELIETGEVVGCIAANNVSESLAYVALYAVSKLLRAKGIGKQLWAEMLKGTGDRTLCLVPTETMDPVYRNDMGFTKEALWYAVHFGVPKIDLTQSVQNITIKPLTEEILPQLSEYDYEITKFEKINYLKQLMKQQDTVNLVAINKVTNQLKGFVSLATMLTDEMPAIFYPIYADTIDIAEVLIKEAFEKHGIAKESGVAIIRFNFNREAETICKKIDLPELQKLPLLATSTIEEIDFSKIFSVGSLAAFHY